MNILAATYSIYIFLDEKVIITQTALLVVLMHLNTSWIYDPMQQIFAGSLKKLHAITSSMQHMLWLTVKLWKALKHKATIIIISAEDWQDNIRQVYTRSQQLPYFLPIFTKLNLRPPPTVLISLIFFF